VAIRFQRPRASPRPPGRGSTADTGVEETQPTPGLAADDLGVTEDAERLAEELWAVARAEEQVVRVVADDALADAVRALVRRRAAAEGVRVRTARMDDTVVVVRRDARIWDQDAATMREKLARPADG
jgi:hypothetical protein